jgi:hypothetical protein
MESTGVPSGLINKNCIHYWYITEKFPPRRSLKVVEKYTTCTAENGTQFMGEKVTCFNRNIEIDERNDGIGYYQMKGNCIKCGMQLDMLFADFVDDVYSGTQKTDQNQKWADENRSYCYPKPTKSHGYDEDNLSDENNIIRAYLELVSENDWGPVDEVGELKVCKELEISLLDDSKSEYLGLIDNSLYVNTIRSEIKNKLGSKYLRIWDILIRLHNKGVPLKFNQIFIEKKDILDNDIFPVVREIVKNFAPSKLNSEPILERHRNGGLGFLDLTPYNAVRSIRGDLDKIVPDYEPRNEWLDKYLMHETIDINDRFLLQWCAEKNDSEL